MYSGSYICLCSAHLFLLASIFNYNWGNYFESIFIFALYFTSLIYHSKPKPNNKILDETVSRIAIGVSIATSLYNSNILPTIFTTLVMYMYYHSPNFTINTYISNIYHAICIHLIGFLGFIALYYNVNTLVYSIE